MGSLTSHIDDILDEYGSFENYLKKTSTDKQFEINEAERLNEQKSDFENLPFSEYNKKYPHR